MASLALKYSSVSSEYIQEYSSIPSSNLNFGLIGQGLSLFGLGILILLTVFYEACSYEIRHSMLEFKSDSRASHKACVIVKFGFAVSELSGILNHCFCDSWVFCLYYALQFALLCLLFELY